MVQTQKKGFVWGWVILLFSLVAHGVVMGFTVYAFPIIFPAMVNANGWSRGDASAPLSIASWVGIACYPLVGVALKRFGGRRVITTGAIGIGIVWILLSQVTELWQWFALRGLGWAIVAPFTSTAAFMTLLVQWFNLRRGIAIGTVFIGYSVFGFISTPIAQLIMQSTKSWQMAWAALGVVFIIMGILCALFLRSKPADVGQFPDGLAPEEAKRAREATMAGQASGYRAIARTYRSPIDWTLGQAIKTRQFWMIVFAMGAFAGGSFALSQVGFIGLARGYSSTEIAFGISLIALGATPWRFIAGWLTDRVEARWCITGGYVMSITAFVLLWTLPSGNLWWLYAYAVLHGAGMSGLVNTILTVITSNYFGAGNFATVYTSGIQVCGSTITSIGPILGGYIYDWTKSYDYAFILFIGMQVVAVVAQLLNAPPRVNKPEVAKVATAA